MKIRKPCLNSGGIFETPISVGWDKVDTPWIFKFEANWLLHQIFECITIHKIMNLLICFHCIKVTKVQKVFIIFTVMINRYANIFKQVTF